MRFAARYASSGVAWALKQGWVERAARTILKRRTTVLSRSHSIHHLDHLAHPRIHLARPTPAAEHAIMADAGLHVVLFQIDRNSMAQIQRGHGLADRADIVALAFHRQQTCPTNRFGLHHLPMPG